MPPVLGVILLVVCGCGVGLGLGGGCGWSKSGVEWKGRLQLKKEVRKLVEFGPIGHDLPPPTTTPFPPPPPLTHIHPSIHPCQPQASTGTTFARAGLVCLSMPLSIPSRPSSSIFIVLMLLLLQKQATKAFLLPTPTTTHSLRRHTVRAMASSASSGGKDKVGFIGLGYMGAGKWDPFLPLTPPPHTPDSPTSPATTTKKAWSAASWKKATATWWYGIEAPKRVISFYQNTPLPLGASPLHPPQKPS